MEVRIEIVITLPEVPEKNVTSLVEVRIEIAATQAFSTVVLVTSLVEVRIEMAWFFHSSAWLMSLPLWKCGLK